MTTYFMNALENYDATTATAIDALPPGQTLTDIYYSDNGIPGFHFYSAGRSFFYTTQVNTNYNSASRTIPNNTGTTLWDGYNSFAPAANIVVGNQGNNFIYIAGKNIDTGTVTFYPAYNAAKKVPAGIGRVSVSIVSGGSGYTHATVTFSGGGGTGATGTAFISAGVITAVRMDNMGYGWTGNPTSVIFTGDGIGASATATVSFSDGTWEYIPMNFSTSFYGNSPIIMNPRNGDMFVRSESCELYQFRASQSYAQEITPYFYPSSTFSTSTLFDSFNVNPISIDTTWLYCPVTNQNSTPINQMPAAMVLIPAALTTDETTYNRKLGYAVYTGGPMGEIGHRAVFGGDGNLYFFSWTYSSSRVFYRLYQFTPPAFAPYGSVTGGGFTDVTPWTTTTGPNTDGVLATVSQFWNMPPSGFLSMFRLPGTNQAVCINKVWGEQFSGGGVGNYVFSCTYVTLSGTPTFDYHGSFVSGLMTASWTSAGSLAAAAYAPVNYTEVNPYIDQSDYVEPGIDYTTRWLAFRCRPVTGGVLDPNSLHTKVVFVQYKFVYGSAPQVLQVVPEDGWDAAYTSYGTTIGFTNVVYPSMASSTPNGTYAAISATDDYGDLSYRGDAGLYDATTAAFYYNGVSYNDAMFSLNAAFVNRQNNKASFGPFPPFLTLSFSGTPPASTQKTFGYIF